MQQEQGNRGTGEGRKQGNDEESVGVESECIGRESEK